MSLRVVPCTLAQANDLVAKIHRHHKPATGHRFSLSLYEADKLVAVAICGRPVARMCDPYGTLEILRCASDGTRNAISKLYGHICRAADAMGFHTVQTYTLPEEGGASMRAAGFIFAGEAGGGQWKHTDGKQRRTDQPIQVKHKWVKYFPHNNSPNAEVDRAGPGDQIKAETVPAAGSGASTCSADGTKRPDITEQRMPFPEYLKGG